MDKKNILPYQGKPVIRTTSGKLPSYLAELSEEALGDGGVDASYVCSVDASYVCSVDASYVCSVDASYVCSVDGDA
ncbi:MAG: microcyclamide/patellamide family RiPP [Nostoc sp. DedQUE11]|nr:microcyclamide/patellamide family RiPP [Nostoc sp. DedQUE11]